MQKNVEQRTREIQINLQELLLVYLRRWLGIAVFLVVSIASGLSGRSPEFGERSHERNYGYQANTQAQKEEVQA